MINTNFSMIRVREMNMDNILDTDIEIFNLILNSPNEIKKHWEHISLKKMKLFVSMEKTVIIFI